MTKTVEQETGDIHIRSSIKKIEHSIEELEKAKSVLISMLPKKILDPSKRIITLPGGKVIDFSGKEVVNGNQM